MSSALKDALTHFIEASPDGDNGIFPTGIDGLHIMRSTELKMPHAMIYRPALCVIVQGAKQLMLHDRVIDYAEMQALIISIELPAPGRSKLRRSWRWMSRGIRRKAAIIAMPARTTLT